jgi:hypothetical protein
MGRLNQMEKSSMASNAPTLKIKRGDDLKLDFTVKDTNSTEAIAAKADLDQKQAAYEAALAADPQVAQDVTDTLAARDAAQTVYDDTIRVDITGWAITSAMGWCGELIANLTVTITDAANGVFNVSAGAGVTENWTPRVYESDIQFNRPGIGKTSSQTFKIEVAKDVTRG